MRPNHRQVTPLPPNAGKPWSAAEDRDLEARFAQNGDLRLLAQHFGRTHFGVEARLVKLGKLPARYTVSARLVPLAPRQA